MCMQEHLSQGLPKTLAHAHACTLSALVGICSARLHPFPRPPSTASQFPHPKVRERALNLVGNMCGDSGLRACLLAAPRMLPAIADACTNGGGCNVSSHLAAANTLYNLSIDTGAQAALLSQGLAARLLPLVSICACVG